MSSPPKTVRNIDVRKQHVMSFRETWHLCIQGVKHRLFRSALTLAVVVLAVAFFMFLLSESMFERSVARGVTGEDLAARAAQITEDMEIAAAEAVASLVPEDQLDADHIIPSALDKSVADVVAKAVADRA